MDNDYSTRTTKLSTDEYFKATTKELIARMNNGSILPSEYPFIQAVLDIKTANAIQDTNMELVKQTRNIVFLLCCVRQKFRLWLKLEKERMHPEQKNHLIASSRIQR